MGLFYTWGMEAQKGEGTCPGTYKVRVATASRSYDSQFQKLTISLNFYLYFFSFSYVCVCVRKHTHVHTHTQKLTETGPNITYVQNVLSIYTIMY